MTQFSTDRARALHGYRESGYHIEREVWSDDEMAELREAAANFAGRVPGVYRPLIQPHKGSPIFAKGLRNPKIINMMKVILGDRISAIQSEYFFGAPGTLGFALHQDDFQVEAGPGNFASAWSALTDVSAANGALIVYPGSHKLGLLPTRKLVPVENPNQDPNARNEETVLPPELKPTTVDVPRGACILIHSHLVHSSHDNRTTGFRESLLTSYIVANAKFRSGNFAKRVEIPL